MDTKVERLYVRGEVTDDSRLLCPIETTIVLFVLNYCNTKNACCSAVALTDATHTGDLQILPLTCVPNVKFLKQSPEDVGHCTLPAMRSGCIMRTGMCAVLRYIVKTSHIQFPQHRLLSLLGYKGICLKSCAEVSVWTKFCEVELPQCVRRVLLHRDGVGDTTIPHELMKLENHLGQPAIIPNIGKRMRAVNKRKQQQLARQDAGTGWGERHGDQEEDGRNWDDGTGDRTDGDGEWRDGGGNQKYGDRDRKDCGVDWKDGDGNWKDGDMDRKDGDKDQKDGRRNQKDGDGDWKDGDKDQNDGGGNRKDGDMDRNDGGMDKKDGDKDQNDGRGNRKDGDKDWKYVGGDQMDGGGDKEHSHRDQEDGGGNLEHVYAEGTDMTLTDLILYPCVTCFLTRCEDQLLEVQRCIPRVIRWYQRLLSSAMVMHAASACGLPTIKLPPYAGQLSVTPNTLHSTNIRDPTKKKFKVQPSQINMVMDKLNRCGVSGTEEAPICGTDAGLPWDDMPSAVNPAEGELPRSRVARKCEQLENLALAVVHVAKENDVIVDFCSGGGHLGILIAHLLPSCKVILVENKEESIIRGEKRIRALGMSNIVMYQCNMDYFTGSFNIGVCLHACGVATDLVLQRCLDNQAKFVICPCCYGGIQDTHTVQYPRSQMFRQRNISYEDYLVLGHAADQTQVGIKQAGNGKKCMLLIDTDRAASAREKRYDVTLCSLQPLSCSPKNNLLVGVPSDTPSGGSREN